MSTSKPTIALVHGAFAESASWNPVIERLHHQGPAADDGERPFAGVVAIGNQLRSLAGDARYVRDVIDSIEGPVILVGHSYGGMVVTEAAAGSDAVVAMVYVAAFAPDTGESAFQLSEKFPGSSLAGALRGYPLASGETELAIERDRFHGQFCADVETKQAALMGATQRPVTQTALTDGLSAATPAWRDRPSWFVYGELDLNIPAELVRFEAERAGARVAREVPGGSHAISVSNPGPVAETILEAVAAVTAEPAPA